MRPEVVERIRSVLTPDEWQFVHEYVRYLADVSGRTAKQFDQGDLGGAFETLFEMNGGNLQFFQLMTRIAAAMGVDTRAFVDGAFEFDKEKAS